MQNIALISDFGYTDNYIGIMKGVINQIAPSCNIIDINHNILPFNISQAAYQLESAYNYFAKGTIFICVVDPGVGSAREILFVEESDYYFIAPNNGVLSHIISSKSKIYSIPQDNSQSYTFHGRDVMAKVAAEFLASKQHNFQVFDISKLILLKDYKPQLFPDKVIAKVLHIDNFGNAITNLKLEHLDKYEKVLIKHLAFTQLVNTYSDVDLSVNLMYVGSSNYVEFACNSANFALTNDIKIGDYVVAFLSSI